MSSEAPIAPEAPARGGDVARSDSDGTHNRGGPAPTRRTVLRHRHFRNIFFAQFVSNLGTWMEYFAIQMFVAQATGRLDDQGILAIGQQAPIALLGIFGGLAADRINRRTLLVVSQLLAGLVAVGIAIISMIDFGEARTAVHWLWGLGVVNGCVMAFNFPAWQVLTPRLVPREELGDAITLNGIQFNLARVVGPAIGGYVLAYMSTPTLLWFNAATFVLMACVVMTTPDAPMTTIVKEAIWPRVRDALRFIWNSRGTRAVFLAQVLLCLLAAPLVRLLSNYVIDVYGLAGNKAEKVGGTLLAIQGGGAVIAGLALRFVPAWYPKHHFIPMAVAGLGLSITLFGLTRTVFTGYVAMAICGWFWIWAFNQSWSALQILTPDDLRGRVMSVVNSFVFGAMAAGAGLAGVTGEFLKQSGVCKPPEATQISVLMLSVPLAIAGFVMMLFRVPEVDNLPRVKGRSRRSRSLIEALTASEHRPRPEEIATANPPSSRPGM